MGGEGEGERRGEDGNRKFISLHLGDYPLTSPLPEEMLPFFKKKS